MTKEERTWIKTQYFQVGAARAIGELCDQIDRLEEELVAAKASLVGTFRYATPKDMEPRKWDDFDE